MMGGKDATRTSGVPRNTTRFLPGPSEGADSFAAGAAAAAVVECQKRLAAAKGLQHEPHRCMYCMERITPIQLDAACLLQLRSCYSWRRMVDMHRLGPNHFDVSQFCIFNVMSLFRSVSLAITTVYFGCPPKAP